MLKKPDTKLDRSGLLNLMVVYLVWSSTYLAIRIAVREGTGFPPFTFGFTRALMGGTILLLWSWIRRKKIIPSRRDTVLLALSGLFLWLGGNGLVTFAEQRMESGLAALMIAAIPIWATIFESLIDRQWPSPRLAVALLLGFSGIALLSVPNLSSNLRADAIAMAALIGAAISWAFGSVLQARNPVSLSNRASAGYQMLFGATAFAIVALLLNEPAPTPSTESLFAWVYLVIFGSVFAFTAYVTALRKLPTRIVMTYAYVNPVLAVILGSLILGEVITVSTIGGTVLVLLGVMGVFRERFQ